eukprot:gene18293-46490_t
MRHAFATRRSPLPLIAAARRTRRPPARLPDAAGALVGRGRRYWDPPAPRGGCVAYLIRHGESTANVASR